MNTYIKGAILAKSELKQKKKGKKGRGGKGNSKGALMGGGTAGL